MEPAPEPLEWDENAALDPAVEQLMLESREDEDLDSDHEEQIEEETQETVPEWWVNSTGALTISILQEAFVKCQPRSSSKYLYVSDLGKEEEEEDAEAQGIEKKEKEAARGMSDALYALYYEWECNKEKHGKSYRHSLEFKQRICGLKGGDAKPDDPKVMEWMNRKKAKFGCHLQTASTSSGTAFSYLEKSGKSLLSNGMLRPMLEA